MTIFDKKMTILFAKTLDRMLFFKKIEKKSQKCIFFVFFSYVLYIFTIVLFFK